jgi:hypothetical protein
MPDFGDETEDAAAQSAAESERAADIAWSRSQPWDVEGPFGKATFKSVTNPETGFQEDQLIGMKLSEELQKEYDYGLSEPERQRGFISGYEKAPDLAAQAYYDRYKEIVAPDQEEQRLNLEKRLFGQGMLGSTGGASLTESLTKAQLANDLQARMESDSQVQAMIDTYRARGAQGLASATALGGLPSGYASLGSGQGNAMSGAAGNIAGIMTQAANTRAMGKIAASNQRMDMFKSGMGLVAGGLMAGGLGGGAALGGGGSAVGGLSSSGAGGMASMGVGSAQSGMLGANSMGFNAAYGGF